MPAVSSSHNDAQDEGGYLESFLTFPFPDLKGLATVML